MRRAAALLILLCSPAMAQLPQTEDGARQNLATGQTGAAQEALERAETRALDRSIPAGTQNIPDDGRMVRRISQARQALAAGNLAGAIQIIDRIMVR